VIAFGDLEQAIVTAVGGIQSGGKAVLASAGGWAGSDRRKLLEHIARQRKPALLVSVHGQDSSGRVGVLLYLACEDWRWPATGRSGVASSHAILNLLTSTLHRSEVVRGVRLMLDQEEVIASDDRGVIWQQSYVANEIGVLLPPRFAGIVLCGEAGDVRVEIGPVACAASTFAFPGVPGAYRQVLGLRGRRITWSGTLRASNDAGLNAIEAAIEDAVAGGQVATMVDPCGREWDECAAVSFHRKGVRERDAVTGQVVQSFELHFEQLKGCP